MKHKKIIFMIVYIIISLSSYAQQQDAASLTLDKYGKQEGSKLVQLSKDVLTPKSNITLYKSLTVNKIDEKKEKEILSAIDGNVKKWETISEVREGGIVQSATYSTSNKGKKEYRYVLISNTSTVWNKKTTKKLTIIYIEGDFPPAKLQEELKKLKSLFIYVNNKRIQIG